MDSVSLRIVFVVFFLFHLPTVFAQTTNPSQIEFESAISLLEKGAYAEALQKFDRLLYSGFTDKAIHKYRGIAKYKQKDFKGAVEDLDKVRSENVPVVDAMLGVCKYEFQDWDAARYFLEKAMRAGYKDGKSQLYLGYLYFRDKNYKEAVEQLTEAEKTEGKETELYISRGISAYYSDDADLAIKDLEKVIQSGKASLLVYETLGLSYAKGNRYSKSLPYLKKADSLSSENKHVYFQFGNSLSDKKLFKEAVEAYTKAIALGYTDAVIYIHRGKAQLKAGGVEESLKDFDLAIKLQPQNVMAYRSRVSANFIKQDWVRVVTDLAIVNALGSYEPTDWIPASVAKYELKNFQGALDEINLAEVKDNVATTFEGIQYSFNLQKGKCLVALMKFGPALSALNQAEKEGEKAVDLYIERARAYVGMEQFENAITDLEKAQLSYPKNAKVFYNSAVIKEELGDFGAAVLDYNKAILLNPKDALAYYGRSNSKARKGDIREAITDLDEAIKIDPENATYYKVRANFHYQMKNKDKACFDWRKAVEYGDEKARFSINKYCAK